MTAVGESALFYLYVEGYRYAQMILDTEAYSNMMDTTVDYEYLPFYIFRVGRHGRHARSGGAFRRWVVLAASLNQLSPRPTFVSSRPILHACRSRELQFTPMSYLGVSLGLEGLMSAAHTVTSTRPFTITKSACW